MLERIEFENGYVHIVEITKQLKWYTTLVKTGIQRLKVYANIVGDCQERAGSPLKQRLLFSFLRDICSPYYARTWLNGERKLNYD